MALATFSFAGDPPIRFYQQPWVGDFNPHAPRVIGKLDFDTNSNIFTISEVEIAERFKELRKEYDTLYKRSICAKCEECGGCLTDVEASRLSFLQGIIF
jgi:hypothetical protein